MEKRKRKKKKASKNNAWEEFMRVIIGLGNPGKKYDYSPHNLGFEVVDILAARSGMTFRSASRSSGIAAGGVYLGCEITLLKPTTFMNLSGEAVSLFLRYHPVDISDLLIITDDINLPMGRLRFREKGSHGGHNGLLSIINRMGSHEFPRLRIGVLPDHEIRDQVRFVLTPFRGGNRAYMDNVKEVAADAVEKYITDGFSRAASMYNVETPPGLEE